MPWSLPKHYSEPVYRRGKGEDKDTEISPLQNKSKTKTQLKRRQKTSTAGISTEANKYTLSFLFRCPDAILDVQERKMWALSPPCGHASQGPGPVVWPYKIPIWGPLGLQKIDTPCASGVGPGRVSGFQSNLLLL
ncbi:hypothetical protein JTE90_021620 [Oedothorax gibbosus]|uniref:Uncharacterized protein n=1 Tax=Oedothorax gibbosus TaxID=931172 RepID=A0AAV6VNX0_9ARAC|nr:hypothetical protein JTE90_021620 [Oedothorax gibbosus]